MVDKDMAHGGGRPAGLLGTRIWSFVSLAFAVVFALASILKWGNGPDPRSLMGQYGLVVLLIPGICLLSCRLPQPWDVVLLSGGLVVGIGTILDFWVMDDGYIFLRYADNVLRGNGAVFNPGEYVEGYTSPLWLALLVVVARVGGGGEALPVVAVLLGICASVATALGLRAVVRALYPGVKAMGYVPAVGVMAASFIFAFWAFSGMETMLHLALFTTATAEFLGFLRRPADTRKLLGSSVLLTAVTLTRPESAILLAIHAGWVVLVSDRDRIRMTTAFAAIPAIVLCSHGAWRLWYYGDLLPNTYYAKVGTPFQHAVFGLEYLRSAAVSVIWVFCFAIPCVRCGDLAGRQMWYLLSLIAGQVAAVVVSGADHFSEYRFFMPIWVLLLAMSAPSFLRCCEDIGRIAKSLRLRREIGRGAALAVLTAIAFTGHFFFEARGVDAAIRRQQGFIRSLEELGHWIARNCDENDRIAAARIGAISFFSRRPVIDMLGLTDRHIARVSVGDGPKDHERFDTAYVLSKRPSIICVGGDGWPDEQSFLAYDHWIPAINDLQNYFPSPDYEYVLVRLRTRTRSIYRRTESLSSESP